MRNAYIADVDDGLCMAVQTVGGEVILIDCGSAIGYWNQSGGRLAHDGLRRIIKKFSAPSNLVLSHFHLDHYSGFIFAASLPVYSRRPLFLVNQIYYPKVPAFSRSTEFLLALLTMNFRLLGDETGVAEYDLVKLVTRLNGGVMPGFTPTCQGTKLNIGGSLYTVLWPPLAVAENSITAKAIVRAISLFDLAIREDEPTRRWYKYVQNTHLPDKYLEGERGDAKYHENKALDFPKIEFRKLSLVVEQANWAIREAANRISLAICEENQGLLFFGDVMSREIKSITEDLLACGKQKFGLLVTPHHGTRWNNTLLKIRSRYAASSCGHRLYQFVRPEFKKIAKLHCATWISGDLLLQW